MTGGFSRRQLLAGAPPLVAAVRAAAAGRRPNILLAISDDQSWLHTSAAGDPVVKTPFFDRIAQSGVRFTHAFSAAPSCTPSRGALLTGQHIWRLEGGANLFNTLDRKFVVYPELLEQAGYYTGFMRKGWGPGNYEAGGRTRNPAGAQFENFEQFHRAVPKDTPFCFWFGSPDPHRPYKEGAGIAAGLKIEDVNVPPWLPDVPDVRRDLLDYLAAIQRFDRQLGGILKQLHQTGELENTLVIVTSDNGMPFARAKATLYDGGTRMPLAISWPARVPGGRTVEGLVSLADLAPTILEAAGLKPRAEMTGRSLLGTLLGSRQGLVDETRTEVYTAMERHAYCRQGGGGYPMRAIRTRDYLYIHNFAPGRWPAGDPSGYVYGEIANSPSKTFLMANRDSPRYGRFFALACEKRPAEELYDLRKDPGQLHNVAAQPEYKKVVKDLESRLFGTLTATGDPRATGGKIIWDSLTYYGQKRA